MKFFTLLISLGLLTAASSAEKPNVILIVVDDLGWSNTTLYGKTNFYETPNIEKLASSGMRFWNAYAAGPLGSPTRASILTGLSPARHGITDSSAHIKAVIRTPRHQSKVASSDKAIGISSATRLDPKFPSLATRLTEEGYTTAHIGKWHLGAQPYSPLEHGFASDFPAFPGAALPRSVFAPWELKNVKASRQHEHFDTRMREEAIAFLDRNKDKPFFLNYWSFSAHSPYVSGPVHRAKYRKKAERADSTHHEPSFATMIEIMDQEIGKLLKHLKKLNLEKNTIVIFTSDNGGNLGGISRGLPVTHNKPLRGGKGSLFEGGIRVPLVISWPGKIEANSHSRTAVQATDLYPTLLELMNLKPENNQKFDGKSFIKVTQGQEIVDRPIFSFFPHRSKYPQWHFPAASVRRGHWKLIKEFYQGDYGRHYYHLYHLGHDEGEEVNLAGDYPEIVAELDQLLDRHLRETGAILPKPNPSYGEKPFRRDFVGLTKGEIASLKNAGPYMNSPSAPISIKKPSPSPPPQATQSDSQEDKGILQGWSSKALNARDGGGFVTLTSTTTGSNISIKPKGLKGPGKFTLRIRSGRDIRAQLGWKDDLGKQTYKPYLIKNRDWNEFTFEVKETGNLTHIRLGTPGAPDIDFFKFEGASGTVTYDF